MNAWKKVYKMDADFFVSHTAFGYKDLYGITKYFSVVQSPYVTMEAGGPIEVGQAVYIGKDNKAHHL
jgi:hypothetical protein